MKHFEVEVLTATLSGEQVAGGELEGVVDMYHWMRFLRRFETAEEANEFGKEKLKLFGRLVENQCGVVEVDGGKTISKQIVYGSRK